MGPTSSQQEFSTIHSFNFLNYLKLNGWLKYNHWEMDKNYNTHLPTMGCGVVERHLEMAQPTKNILNFLPNRCWQSKWKRLLKGSCGWISGGLLHGRAEEQRWHHCAHHHSHIPDPGLGHHLRRLLRPCAGDDLWLLAPVKRCGRCYVYGCRWWLQLTD